MMKKLIFFLILLLAYFQFGFTRNDCVQIVQNDAKYDSIKCDWSYYNNRCIHLDVKCPSGGWHGHECVMGYNIDGTQALENPRFVVMQNDSVWIQPCGGKCNPIDSAVYPNYHTDAEIIIWNDTVFFGSRYLIDAEPYDLSRIVVYASADGSTWTAGDTIWKSKSDSTDAVSFSWVRVGSDLRIYYIEGGWHGVAQYALKYVTQNHPTQPVTITDSVVCWVSDDLPQYYFKWHFNATKSGEAWYVPFVARKTAGDTDHKLYFAYSSDGDSFEICPDVPMINVGPNGAWDDTMFYRSALVENGGDLILYYVGYDLDHWRMGHANVYFVEEKLLLRKEQE